MKDEVVQGAGNIPPFIVESSTLLPSSSAKVNVFETIKGSHPLQVGLFSLQPGLTYFGRLTSYNERGFSVDSALAQASTIGQPSAPSATSLSIASGTSLNVSWSYPTDVDLHVDSFVVESFSSTPKYEVQMITTSSTGSLAEVQRITVEADKNNIAGYFKLEYGGEITQNIQWNAEADGDYSVAQALVRLSTVGPIQVSKDFSKRYDRYHIIVIVKSLFPFLTYSLYTFLIEL
jgi:hypothetical protein